MLRRDVQTHVLTKSRTKGGQSSNFKTLPLRIELGYNI